MSEACPVRSVVKVMAGLRWPPEMGAAASVAKE